MVGPARPQIVLFGSSIVQQSFSNGGWGAILADIYSRKADIILRGYSGWNSRRALQVLDKVFMRDAPTQPSLIVVYFGGNDSMGPHPSGLGPHVPLSEYVENMRKIAIHLKKHNLESNIKHSTTVAIMKPMSFLWTECRLVARGSQLVASILQGLSETTRLIFLSCPPVDEEKVRGISSNAISTLVRTNALCRSYSDACIELCKELSIEVIDLWTAIQKRDDWLTCFTDGIHLSAEGSKVVVEEILKVLKEADWEPSLHWKSMPTEFSEDSPYDLVSYNGTTTINCSDWTFHRDIQWD